MKIVADSQIPLAQEAFSSLGELELYAGRSITSETVRDADILLVRSVTPVNAELLANSRVRFVATATSGIDHIDTALLQKSGIGFASAHGSNAQSVVEYVLSSIFVLAEQLDIDLKDKTAGIIGCGAVGSLLCQALQATGMKCLLNDPPLQEQSCNPVYEPLEDVLQADIISLHVPLTTNGPYPTINLLNENNLPLLKRGAILINTSRGGVISKHALGECLKLNKKMSVVLDVWDHEPEIDLQLLSAVAIGTPHIAGYSTDAKIRATDMIYKAVCRYLTLPDVWQPAGGLLDEGLQEFSISDEVNDTDAIAMVIKAHYDVRSDAASLRRVLEFDRKQTGQYFDELRKNYPLRREFFATTIKLPAYRNHLANQFLHLGFTVIEL